MGEELIQQLFHRSGINSFLLGNAPEFKGEPGDLAKFSYRPSEKLLVFPAMIQVRAEARKLAGDQFQGVYEGLVTQQGWEVQIHHSHNRREENWWSLRIAGRVTDAQGQERIFQLNYEFYGNYGITYFIPDVEDLYKKNPDLCSKIGSAYGALDMRDRLDRGHLLSHGWGLRGWLAKWLFAQNGKVHVGDIDDVGRLFLQNGYIHVRKTTTDIVYKEILPLMRGTHTV